MSAPNKKKVRVWSAWALNPSLISCKLRVTRWIWKLSFFLIRRLSSLGVVLTWRLVLSVIFPSDSGTYRLTSCRLKKVKRRRSWRGDYLRSCWRCSWTQSLSIIAWPMTWPTPCRGRAPGRVMAVPSGRRYSAEQCWLLDLCLFASCRKLKSCVLSWFFPSASSRLMTDSFGISTWSKISLRLVWVDASRIPLVAVVKQLSLISRWISKSY